MSEEQVTGSTESSTATEAPNTAGKSEDSQSADASTGSPSPGETHVKTKTAPSEQNGNAKTQDCDELESVLNDRTFLDRILDAVSPSSLQRLRNALPRYEQKLKALKPEGSQQCPGWWTSAKYLLEQAAKAANAGDSEKGWQCFNAADRFMLYGLDTQARRALLRNQATIIVNYATDDKKGLPKWRQDCIKTFLTDDKGEVPGSVAVENVVEAKFLLDEFNDNVYRRLGIVKSRLFLLTMAGLTFLLVWLFCLQPPVPAIVVSSSVSKATPSAGTNDATSGEASTPSASPAAIVDSGDTGVSSSSPVTALASGEASASSASPAVTKAPPEASTPSVPPAATKAPAGASGQQAPTRSVADTFWWMVVLAGLLGGLISAFTSAIRSDIRKSNIPAEMSTYIVTFARLMLAALSALAITLFLTSGLLSFEQLSYELILAIAIVSGFTERLLLRVMDQVAKTA